MNRRRFLPALLLLAAACGRGSSEDLPPVSPAEVPVRLNVTNNYAMPVEIYVIGSGINQRLGMVHPGMTARFSVPPALVGNGSVEFQAKPVNEPGVMARSGALLVSPGAIVDFNVASTIFNSTATIR